MDADSDDHTPFFFFHHHHDRIHVDPNVRTMLTSIVSLSFIISLVVILHLYARCVLAHHARRQAAIRQLGLTTAQVHRPDEPRPGLDRAAIDLMPKFVFGQAAQYLAGENDKNVECAVCLNAVEEEEVVRLLPNCNHIFHAECVDKWLISHPTCPICRTDAEPRASEPAAVPIVPASFERNSNGEGTSGDGDVKSGESTPSRLSSLRRMLSRERSSRRNTQTSCEQEDSRDLERQ